MKHISLCAAIALLGLAGCASQPAPPPGQAFVASADAQPSARTRKILDLLANGDLAPAKVEAQALIAEDPGSVEGKVLLAEMDQDPKTLLGTLNFDLKAKTGDTFAGLADRYLHDRSLAYALARYNGVNPPNQPTPGQVVQIPGSPLRAAAAEAPVARRREHAPAAGRTAEPPAKPKPAASDKPDAEKPAAAKPAPDKPPPPAPKPPAEPAKPPHDPAKAASLRSDALVLMNKGDIGQAVVVLRQAAALDPDSAPIKADLDRALRIQHGPQAPGAKP